MPKIPASMRRIVAIRARGYCEYCRCSEQYTTESFTVEHIKPKNAGGETAVENLAWSCSGCNGHKHAKIKGLDLETREKIALYNPRQQLWSEHFEWSDDFTEVTGKTAASHMNGRAGMPTPQELLIN